MLSSENILLVIILTLEISHTHIINYINHVPLQPNMLSKDFSGWLSAPADRIPFIIYAVFRLILCNLSQSMVHIRVNSIDFLLWNDATSTDVAVETAWRNCGSKCFFFLWIKSVYMYVYIWLKPLCVATVLGFFVIYIRWMELEQY